MSEFNPSMLRGCILAVVSVVCIGAWSGVASAQGQPDEAATDEAPAPTKATKPTKAALDLNDHGVENIVAGNYARAVAQLEEAVLRGGEFNIIYLNLGRAYQKLGNCAKARAALAKAKTAPPVDDPPAKLVAKKADQYLAELPDSCADEHKATANGQGDRHTAPKPDPADAPAGRSGQAVAAQTPPPATPPAAPPSVRAQHPNLAYLEFAGHGLVPTLNYERFFWQNATWLGIEFDASLGIGVGSLNKKISWGSSSHKLSGTAVPVFASASFLGDHHSLYGQVGVNFLDAKIDEDASAFLGLPYLQVGYQFQGSSGFMLRASGTVMPVVGGTLGLSVGWSF